MMSVLLFVKRIYRILATQKVFNNSLLTKIGTFHFLFLFLLFIKFFSVPFSFLTLSLCTIFIFPILLFVISKIHQQHFHSEFLRFLSLIIIKMQMGLSFVSAVEQSIQSNDWRYGRIFQQIFENVVFSQQKKLGQQGHLGLFIERIVNEFKMIHQHQHQAIDRLCNFRQQLHGETFFRRRSGQIWFYFFYQVGILSVIYVTIFTYVLLNHSFLKFKTPILLSVLLFLGGIFFVFIIVRLKKWNI